jgi:hypothetical protein
MAILVRFSRDGWYHPAFGRLGRGKGADTIYRLPDQFAERETIKVPVMDHSSKPPRQIAEKTIERYKFLPESVHIIEPEEFAELVQLAEDENEAAPKAITPRIAEDGALAEVTGRGKIPKVQSAKDRTAGNPKPKRPARRAVKPQEAPAAQE